MSRLLCCYFRSARDVEYHLTPVLIKRIIKAASLVDELPWSSYSVTHSRRPTPDYALNSLGEKTSIA